MSSDLVGIHLDRATRLATALEAGGRELGADLERLTAVAAVTGTSPTAVVDLRAVQSWMTDAARQLRGIVALLDDDDRSRRGPARWSGPALGEPGDLVAARALARRVQTAIAAGAVERAVRLLERHGDDPQVATFLLAEMGPRAVAHAVVTAVRLADGSGSAAAWSLVDGLGAAVVAAWRYRTSPFSMAALGRATADLGSSPAVLGVLVAGARGVPLGLGRSLATSVLLPANRTVLAAPAAAPDVFVVLPRSGRVDARTLVLRALAASPEVAPRILADHGLDALAAADLAYGDRGVALADFLVAATAPGGPGVRTGADGPAPVLPATNLAGLVEWTAAGHRLPVATEIRLGEVFSPWIGAFRSDGLRGRVAHHVHLAEVDARAALTRAAAFATSAERLRDAAWSWAAAELGPVARSRSAAGFDEIGSVLGLVTAADRAGRLHRARHRDTAIERSNRVWRHAARVVTRRVPSPLGPVTAAASNEAVERLLPDAVHEEQHWQAGREALVRVDAEAFEWLVWSELWATRDHHGRFGSPGDPGWPPAGLLVDPDRPDLGLRPLPELSPAEAAAWEAWRSRLVADGVAAVPVALDAFARELREGEVTGR